MGVKVGQDIDESLRQHRFPRAGRPKQKHVVSSRRGGDQRVDDIGLPDDVGQVSRRGIGFGLARGLDCVNVWHHDVGTVLSQGVRKTRHGDDLDTWHEFRLGSISRGDHNAPSPRIARGDNSRQHSGDRSDPSVESKFTDMNARGDRFCWHVSCPRQNRQRDGEVESAALFRQARG